MPFGDGRSEVGYHLLDEWRQKAGADTVQSAVHVNVLYHPFSSSSPSRCLSHRIPQFHFEVGHILRFYRTHRQVFMNRTRRLDMLNRAAFMAATPKLETAVFTGAPVQWRPDAHRRREWITPHTTLDLDAMAFRCRNAPASRRVHPSPLKSHAARDRAAVR